MSKEGEGRINKALAATILCKFHLSLFLSFTHTLTLTRTHTHTHTRTHFHILPYWRSFTLSLSKRGEISPSPKADVSLKPPPGPSFPSFFVRCEHGTECIRDFDWTVEKMARWLLSCNYWPLLLRATIFDATQPLPEITIAKFRVSKSLIHTVEKEDSTTRNPKEGGTYMK